MTTQAQREAIRRQAMAKIEKSNRVHELAIVTAKKDKDEWPVKIRVRADEYFEVCGRGTSLTLYLTETNSGYLVSVPNHNRCGLVPADCDAYGVMDYVGIENEVDATTLAAAIFYLINIEGLAMSHPPIPMVTGGSGD